MSVTFPVLVLNASYEPLHICSVKRAVRMLFTQKAHLVEARQALMRSSSAQQSVPSVIRLSSYVRVPYLDWVFNRKNIFLRDNYVCQYCGVRGAPSHLTLDHVIPRSRGGHTTWENVVTSCSDCNHRKADYMPWESGFEPKRAPKRPGSRCVLMVARYSGNDVEQWKRYLFMEQAG